MNKRIERRARRIANQLSPTITAIDECLARLVVVLQLEARRTDQEQVDLSAAIGATRQNPRAVLDEFASIRGEFDLEIRWMVDSFLKIENAVKSRIQPERVAAALEAGQPIDQEYNKPLKDAIEAIDHKQDGVLDCIKEIFKVQRHPTAVLCLVAEIRERVLAIRRQLLLPQRRVLQAIRQPGVLAILLLLAVVTTPLFYAYRAFRAAPAAGLSSIPAKISRDRETIDRISRDPDKSGWERTVGVVKELSEITSAIPNLLVLASIVIGITRWIINARLQPRHPVEGRLEEWQSALQEMSASLRSQIGAKDKP
jgi:hypothetical protein